MLARVCPVLVVVDVLRFTTAVEVAVAHGVAAAARTFGGPVGLVPAGERYPDGSLRPAVEDLIGAGAILHALDDRPSPEARAAVAAFLHTASDLPATLTACTSGRELTARGQAAD
jgi:2-phosphosulfolactate phosphatase